MKSPTCNKEVQILNRCLTTLNWFLSKSTNKCKPFFQTIKKNGVDFRWDEQCEAVFQSPKAYLASPPLLSEHLTDKTLFLYLTVSNIAVSAILVRKDEGVQKLVYYVSKSLINAQMRYTRIENLIFILFITTRKLTHYFQSFSIVVLMEYPLRVIVEND